MCDISIQFDFVSIQRNNKYVVASLVFTLEVIYNRSFYCPAQCPFIKKCMDTMRP